MTVNSQVSRRLIADLREGNRAWRANGRSPDLELAPHGARREVAVVCCSDQKRAPELVLDRRLGDLLVVQTPGPVAEGTVMSTLRYGVASLGVQLVVVMTHEGCWTLAQHRPSEPPSSFRDSVERPLSRARLAEGHAARVNAEVQAEQIERELSGLVAVVPAVLRANGEVEFLDDLVDAREEWAAQG